MMKACQEECSNEYERKHCRRVSMRYLRHRYIELLSCQVDRLHKSSHNLVKVPHVRPIAGQ